MNSVLNKLSQLKKMNLAAQIATILIILTVPIFVFTAQQETKTQQFAAVSSSSSSNSSMSSSSTSSIGGYPETTTTNDHSGICTATCSKTTSCGHPTTIRGKISIGNNNLENVKVRIFTHNRNNGVYTDSTESNSTKIATTNGEGIFTLSDFICDGNSRNTNDYGDNYAVRPIWNSGECATVGCSAIKPIEYNSQQVNKRGTTPDCRTKCDFNEKLTNGPAQWGNSSNSKSSSSSVTTTNVQVIATHCNLANVQTQPCEIEFKNNGTNAATWKLAQNNPYSNNIQEIANKGDGSINAGETKKQTFKTNCSGQNKATIKFDFTPPTTNDPNPVEVELDCSNGNMKILAAFVGLNKPPGHTTRKFSLNFTPASKDNNASRITIPGNMNYDPDTNVFQNELTLDTIPPGDYQISIHTDGALDSQLINNDGSKIFKLPTNLAPQQINLILGDVSPGTIGDNFLDIIDYNKIIGCYNKPATGDCETSDINDNGTINEDDLSLLLGRFGELGFSFTTPQFTCAIDPACDSGKNTLQMCQLICTKQ